MFSRIIPKAVTGKDICEIGADHNPGSSNVFVNCGIPLGFVCLFLDMFKGFLPVWIAVKTVDTKNILFAAVLAAPVLGHAVAPLNHFHGGKCIATAFGEMIALLWITRVGLILAGLYIFFSVAVVINPVRLRSMLTFCLFAFIGGTWLWISGKESIAVGCVIISVIAILRHTKWLSAVSDTAEEQSNNA